MVVRSNLSQEQEKVAMDSGVIGWCRIWSPYIKKSAHEVHCRVTIGRPAEDEYTFDADTLLNPEFLGVLPKFFIITQTEDHIQEFLDFLKQYEHHVIFDHEDIRDLLIRARKIWSYGRSH